MSEHRPLHAPPCAGYDTNSDKWCLTYGVELYKWQIECRNKYSGEGIAKVVTGVGKTILAFSIIEDIHNRLCPALNVLIVVPTIVLMRQWYRELLAHSNIPAENIGVIFGNRKDCFDSPKRILVGVCNSISKITERLQAPNLLLIADECHRYSGEKMQKCLDVPHDYSLGLSATPEGSTTDDTLKIVSKKLGDIFYSLNYAEATKYGYLPRFEIRHIGISLTPEEQIQYRELTDEISDLTKEIMASNSFAGRTNLLAFAIKRSNMVGGSSSIYSKYISSIVRRKNLIFSARNRKKAVLCILDKATQNNEKCQVLVFHERINEINDLFETLMGEGYSVGIEHSELPKEIREKNIEQFRCGATQILISGRSLIEGFDAPSADIGISMASSASRTKVVQSIGRILRKTKRGSSKFGIFYKLYTIDTTDELIYEDVDFSVLTGAECNRFFIWSTTPTSASFVEKEVFSPPRCRLPLMSEIDWASTPVGTQIRCRFEGKRFQIDGLNNIYVRAKSKKIYVSNPQNILDVLAPFRTKMENNYIYQSLDGFIFISRGKETATRQMLFCGQTREPFLLYDEADLDEQFKLVRRKEALLVQYVHKINGEKCFLSSENMATVWKAIERCPIHIKNALHRISIFDERNVCFWENNQCFPVCTLPNNWRHGILFSQPQGINI